MMSDLATASDPVLPEAKMNIVPPTKPVIGRVVSTKSCMKGKSASFIRHVAIDVSGTPLAGNFLVGQSFGVIPPGVDEKGKPHKVRLYSIASPSYGEDGEGNVLSTTPKRVVEEVPFRSPTWFLGDAGAASNSELRNADSEEDIHDLYLGVCSNYLCNLRVGDEVKVSGPSGKRFLLPVNPNDHDFIFIATGTGIAPFRGMAMELLETSKRRNVETSKGSDSDGPGEETKSQVADKSVGHAPATRSVADSFDFSTFRRFDVCSSQIHLLMGAPYTTDLLYDDLFTRYAGEHENFHYHTAISREKRLEASGQMTRGLYVDRLIEEKIDVFRPLLESPRTLIYICGLAGMQVGVFTALATLGLAEGYLNIKPELADVPPSKWEPAAVKRYVRSTNRCMLEVY